MLVFLAGSSGVLWLRLTLGRDLAHDFTAFYLAGKISPASLYDQTAYRTLGERTLRPLGIWYYPPYVRPAVFAIPLRVFGWLPYWTGFTAWLFVQLACYLAAVALAFRTYRPPLWALAAFGFFYPALVGPTVGQDTNVLAAIVAVSMALLASGRDGAAGAVLACGLCKFSLMGFFPLVFLVHGRRRAFLWFSVTGILLALASILLSSPDAYVGLLRHVRDYTGVSGETAYGIRGVVALLGVPWLYYPAAAALTVVTLLAMRRLPVQEAFCLAAIACLLLAYQAAWYDAPLLVAPLAAAFARGSVPTLLPAFFLLLYPGWAHFPGTLMLALATLYAGFVVPAFRQKTEGRVASGSACS